MKYKLSRSFSLIFLIVMVMIFIVGCGGGQATNKQEKSETTNESPTEANKEVKILKFSIQSPPESPLAKAVDAHLDHIEELSEGTIEFERYYLETLGKAEDHLNMVSKKVADVTMFLTNYTPSRLPLSMVAYNPILFEDSWPGAKAFNELVQTHPAMQKEMEENNIKFIGQYATTSSYIFSTKSIKSLQDLKGLKISATGQFAELLQALGAVPVTVSVNDLYESLERGVVDAAMVQFNAAAAYGLHDVVDNVYKLPLGGIAGSIAMNLETWNTLPKDLQEKIMDASATSHPDSWYEIYQVGGDGPGIQKFEEAGAEIVEPSEDDITKLKALAEEMIWNHWIEEMEKNGLPGNDVFTTFTELVAKYEQQNPHKK